MKLQIKYHELALMPCDLTSDPKVKEYECIGGERVRFHYLSTWNNTDGRYNDELERESQEIYGMDFVTVSALWGRRLGKQCNWWHKVRMEHV